MDRPDHADSRPPGDGPRRDPRRTSPTGDAQSGRTAPGGSNGSWHAGRLLGGGRRGATGGGRGEKRAREKAGAAGQRLGEAGRKVGKASKVGAAGVASFSRKTATVTGKAGRATGRRIRGLTSAQGAGESGLSRLIELGAVNAAGDTAFAVSLAGTVFFAVPSEQARDRVALFLLLTMAPFALMAPLIGPILDRFRHGRRWAIGATLGLRGFLVWSLAASIATDSAWLYPAALGCLVASKAYGVTRASAVPRLLPKQITLVTANSRISLAGVAGATVGAGIAGAFAAIGPEWSLRWAALVYTVGLILAIRLPSRVDSPADEEATGTTGKNLRRRSITAAVARGIRCNLGLRFVSGFLTMYLAFLLRDHPIAGLNGAVAAGAVIAAAGIGNSLGTLTGSLLRARKPEAVVLVVLLADATVAVLVAILYGFPVLIALGLVAGLCSSLGKLSLDAMIQRDVPEAVRTSVFARSETVLQLAWVTGGGCGIVLPLIPRLGFGFLAAVLVLLIVVILRHKPTRPAASPTPPPTTPRTDRGPRPAARTSPHPAAPSTSPHTTSGTAGPRPDAGSPDHDDDHRRHAGDRTDPDATTRTILTTSVSEQRAARARHDEPTVEIRPDHTPDPPLEGRWWSGHPDDDETPPTEIPGADDTTVERPRNPFRRRNPGSRPPR